MADLISRKTMKDAIDSTTWYHQNRNGVMVEGAHGVEDAWFKAEDVFKAIENVPTAQPNTPTDTPTDLISRQAAIDNLLSINEVVPKNKLIDKNDAVKMLVRLPSAQPGIVRCRECKHRLPAFGGVYICDRLWDQFIDDDFFCADGERRSENE